MKQLSKELSERHAVLWLLVVAEASCLLLLMWLYGGRHPWLLHLYYLPVILTAFYLGRHRAWILAGLSVVSVGCLLGFNLFQNGLQTTWPEMLLWSCTLILTSIFVGILSDSLRISLDELTEAHQRDVLTDALTGIANRRAFEYDMARRVVVSKERGVPLALVLVDIDDFKKLNDHYGHPAGDHVLRTVAQELKKSVRPGDLVARYGGEEFAILLSDTEECDIQALMETMRRAIQSYHFMQNDFTIRSSISLGGALMLPSESEAAVIDRADIALYCSKDAGRNCSHFHNGQTSCPSLSPCS